MRNIAILILIFSSGLLYSQQNKKIVLEQISVLSKKNDSLQNQQSKTDLEIIKLNSYNKNISEKLTQLETEISSIEEQNNTNKNNTKIGALILLFGLLLEVLGVIFLSSDSLSKKTRKIRPVKVEYTISNSGGNRTLELEIITLQIIGTIFLVFGFAFQFIGTLLVLTSDLLINSLGIISILIGIFIFSYIVVKYIGKENIFEKLKTTFKNFRGIIMFRLERKFHKRKEVVCETCYKTVPISQATVGYLNPKKMDHYEHPRHLHIGHEKCIDPIFEISRQNPSDNYSVVSKPLTEFLKNDFDEIKEILKITTEKHGDWDTEFKQTVIRISEIEKYYI
ncbi:hypothetical protein IMCC3317_15890 [Kordia antarctica]|uniref:Uncharacterized protein n=2 Tax=Kordia antarctica TaxID=1218801 RepID=A0A7L4ZI80_9FLAO|nr:hypothetical protein IMCC3317_15890 [Kordia antarctica]